MGISYFAYIHERYLDVNNRSTYSHIIWNFTSD